MKFKKVMLVTFLLLAILTIGAVSASEDADALAVDEIGGGDLDIAESSVDDTTVSGEDDGEALLGDSEPSLDNDHIFMGMDNITYREGRICEISDSYSGGGNSRISVYANESLVFDETFESDGMVHYILAKELNGTFNGFYNIKVIYTQSNGIKGYNEQLTYFDNIVGKSAPPKPEDFNVTIADELDLDADRDNVAIRWYVPATVLDGRIELDGDISGYKYIYEDDADSFMEFKLKDLSLTKPGTYDIVVNYVDDDWNTLELATGTLNVTKTYSADDFIELYNKNVNSADDYIFWVHELDGKRPEGKVSIFYNGNQAFARTYIGTMPAYVTGDDLVGYFEGECIFTVVYERDADGKQYSKNLTANFINPINNKAPTPEDFNVTFPVKELTLNDGSTVIMRYFVPDGIDDNSASLRLRYGPGTIDYINIFLEKADINKTKEFTFEKLYIWDQGTLNLELSYYRGEDKILDIANSTLKVTKVYTADNFIEVYTKTISDPTDYVCNVFDSDAGLVGDVTVLANNTSVYSKKFTDASNTAVRINGNNLTGDLKGSYNIKVVYKRAADGKEYSKQAYITFGSSEPVQDTRPFPNLELDIADIKYGNDAIINITADSTFSGVVLVEIGEIKLNVTVKDGFGTDKVSNLNAKDDYYALATFTAKDSDAFRSEYAGIFFSVKKIWSSVYLDDYEFDLDYGDSLKINVTNLKGATGFIAKLDDENATVEGNSIIISGLTSGTHYLDVYTIPEDNYKEDSVQAVIKVASPKPKIIMDENIVLIKGSSINVNVTTIGAKGITAKIDGNDAAVNGYAIEIPGSLSVGPHTLTVTTIPDTGFEAVTQTATITVKKFQSAVSIQNDNLEFDYNKSASTEVSFENATGFTAEIDGQPKAVAVNGNVITVSGLKPGSYTLKVTTVVGEAYDPATATANITVNKLKSIVSISDNLVFDYNQSATVDVSYDADNVTAVVVGQPDAKVNVTGYKVTVSGLDAGKYELIITPDVDAEIYDITAAKANITVNKLQTGISIKDDVIVFDYKGNASTTVLCDAKFVAEVIGQSGAAVVNGNVVTVSGLNPGDYTLKVTIDDANYEPATATANVTVNRIASGISVDNIAFTYGSSGSAVVSTEAGAIIAEVIGQPKANVVVSGKKVTVSGLAAGDYVLKVTTNDAAYEVSSATANITVKQVVTSVEPLVWKTTTTYYTSGTIIVCLKDANGNPIQGKSVTVVIGKYSYNGVTNGKGRIYVTTAKKLTSGNYWPEITFAGDENYTASSGLAKLVVNKATPKFIYTKKVTYKRTSWNKKYTVALKTDLGYKMKNTYVVLKVNNVKYKGYTNYKGQITFNLKKLTKKGYYVGYLQYGGDKYCYNALKLKVKITVK